MDFKGLFSKKKSVNPNATPNADGSAAGAASGSNGNNGAKPPGDVAGGGDGSAGGGGTKPDPANAYKWFERAKIVADSRQYDYAIECYTQGLRRDPDNMNQHEALREVAVRRRVNGGKPASPLEKMKPGGKTALERMLHAEMLWAKEPFSVPLMLGVMERAVEADLAEPELNLAEVADWVGNMILDGGQRDKPLKKADLLKVRELFRTIRVYDKAIEACRMALQLDRTDTAVLVSLRDLETESTMQKAKFDDIKGKGESTFRTYVRDQDKQDDLAAQDQIVKTESTIDRLIANRRAEVEAEPDDPVRQAKLANALQEKETDESQDEAIGIYKELWEKTKQYLYKEQAGNILIKMYNRQLRGLRKAMEEKPKDEQAAAAYKKLLHQLRECELEEWTDRVKNYPTEPNPKFHMGKLLFEFKRYDEAIAAFQQTKIAPALRAKSMLYLGKCYIIQGWPEEALAAFEEGIANYALSSDQLGMELRYCKMDALDLGAQKSRDLDQAREALKCGSQILQNNINYKDIKERMEKVRKLIGELQEGTGGAESKAGGVN